MYIFFCISDLHWTTGQSWCGPDQTLQFCAIRGEGQKILWLHCLQLSWCISNVHLCLFLGLIVALTDICASPKHIEVSNSFWLLDFILPRRCGFNSCMILGGKEYLPDWGRSFEILFSIGSSSIWSQMCPSRLPVLKPIHLRPTSYLCQGNFWWMTDYASPSINCLCIRRKFPFQVVGQS